MICGLIVKYLYLPIFLVLILSLSITPAFADHVFSQSGQIELITNPVNRLILTDDKEPSKIFSVAEFLDTDLPYSTIDVSWDTSNQAGTFNMGLITVTKYDNGIPRIISAELFIKPVGQMFIDTILETGSIWKVETHYVFTP